MSEPIAGLLQVSWSEDALARWLAGPVAKTSDWADWREMPSEWYGDGGIVSMETVSQGELDRLYAECDERLALFANNESALEAILSNAEEPSLAVRKYDAEAKSFIAGTLTYGENVGDFLFFLTVMRGCTRYMEGEDAGVIVLADYIFGSGDGDDGWMALRLGAGGSQWLSPAETAAATDSFREAATAMIRSSHF